MAQIFPNRPGRAIGIPLGESLPGSLRVLTGGNRFNTNVIFTGLDGEQSSNVQFQQSLSNAIYVYSFGDRMGQFTIRGVAFSGNCSGGGSRTGVENILRYYSRYGVGNNNTTVEIRLGTTPIVGFLTGVQIGTADAQFRSYNFTLRINSIPQINQRVDADATTRSEGNNRNGRDDRAPRRPAGGGNPRQLNGTTLAGTPRPLPSQGQP